MVPISAKEALLFFFAKIIQNVDDGFRCVPIITPSQIEFLFSLLQIQSWMLLKNQVWQILYRDDLRIF